MIQTSGPIRHTTAQGLTIIAEQMPVDAVNCSLWIKSGSAAEPDEHNGIAHFLEHMVFKGTQRLAPGDFEKLVEQRGGTMNAVTSQDYTCFYHTVAPQDFKAIAPHQIDLVMNAHIPAAEYERERHVVLEEIRRAKDNPRHRIFSQTMSSAFAELPYRRPVLGPSEIIESLPHEVMVKHHHHHYRPQNMTAVVVGNLPVEELIQTVEAGFEPWTFDSAASSDSRLKTEPAFTESQDIHIVDPQLSQGRLILLWHVPGINQLSQTYPFDLLARYLSSGRNSKLVRELREEKGLVSSISASNFTLAQHGLFWIAAQLPEENIEAVKTSILEHVQALQKEEVNSDRLQQIQRQMANQFIFENEAPSSRAGLYGYHDAIANNLEAGLEYPQRVKQITPEQIKQSAQKHLGQNNYRCLQFTAS